jgi:glycosyltransferase involved in cell wall biosynthesis
MSVAPDITAVLNAHREGLLAHASLTSMKRAIAAAAEADIRVELLCILDRGDDLTRAVIKGGLGQDDRLIEVAYGDLGRSRNTAVDEARGAHIAFLDADDFWGTSWLVRAHAEATKRADSIVWHPEVCAFFDGTKHILHHVDMETPSYRPVVLMDQNYWTALSFARRSIYLDTPYPPSDIPGGVGFEDWAWNKMTICKGVLHKIVPNTGHVIRRRTFSLSHVTVASQAVPHSMGYLRHLVEGRQRSAKSMQR